MTLVTVVLTFLLPAAARRPRLPVLGGGLRGWGPDPGFSRSGTLC